MGVNVSLDKYYPPFDKSDSSSDLLKITLYDSCQPIYEKCLESEKKQGINLYCENVCGEFDQIPNYLDYVYRDNVVVSGPKGFSKALNLAADNAKNCYGQLSNFFGAQPLLPLYARYAENNLFWGSCGQGGESGIYCTLSNLSSSDNTIIEKGPENNFDYNTQKKFVDAGYCMTIEQIVGGQIHEMTHWFARNNFPLFNMFLAEGIARYTESLLGSNASSHIYYDDYGKKKFANDVFFYEAQMNTNSEDNFCSPNGWVSNNVVHEYKIGPYDYNTGFCLLHDIEKKYGLSSIPKILHQSNKFDNGCVKFFKDIINPVVKDDAFAFFKAKYNMETDPEVCLTK
jgi:hypothetical protein